MEAGCGCTGPNLFNCELIFFFFFFFFFFFNFIVRKAEALYKREGRMRERDR